MVLQALLRWMVSSGTASSSVNAPAAWYHESTRPRTSASRILNASSVAARSSGRSVRMRFWAMSSYFTNTRRELVDEGLGELLSEVDDRPGGRVIVQRRSSERAA